MLHHLADFISLIEPHAVLLALVLPPVIRVVGHWLPEELFMVSMGVLAARSPSPAAAGSILSAVFLSHFATDQAVYLIGRWLRPRLVRFPKIESRLTLVTDQLGKSRSAILGLVPARVLPLGRGAWLAACGVVRVPWARFAAVDLAALIVHVAVWSGLGWWLAGDLGRLATSVETGKVAGTWLAIVLIAVISTVLVWRARSAWQPASWRAVRRAGRSLRDFGRGRKRP